MVRGKATPMCDTVKKFYSFWIIFAVAILQTGCAQVISNDGQDDCLTVNEEKSCEDNEIKFYLRVRDSSKTGGSIEHIEYNLSTTDSSTIKDAKFIKNKFTKFIIHGHEENRDDILITPLVQEYLKLNYNVVLVEYSNLSAKGCYKTAVRNSPFIAKCSTKILLDIAQHNTAGIQLADFHIIGMSLGGQLAGQMPNYLEKNGPKFSRITGIDPANEGFYEKYEEDEFILTKNDALFVDVVHTNSGFIGKFRPMGHADFYANSGIFQPGCEIGYYLCSHIRSVILFVETIANEQLQVTATQCSSLEKWFDAKCENSNIKVTFGEYSVKSKPKGIFFFHTKAEGPYIGSNTEIVAEYVIYDKHLKKIKLH